MSLRGGNLHDGTDCPVTIQQPDNGLGAVSQSEDLAEESIKVGSDV